MKNINYHERDFLYDIDLHKKINTKKIKKSKSMLSFKIIYEHKLQSIY